MITPAMTDLLPCLSPRALDALGWALLNFLWQGTAIAAVAAGAMAFCRSASVRYGLGVVALCLMLAAPALTFGCYLQAGFARVDRGGPASFDAPARLRGRADPPAGVAAPPSPVLFSGDAFPWLVEAWLIGVAFFSFRTVGGFWLLERQRRQRSAPASERVLEIGRALQQRLRLDRAIVYSECEWLQTPAVMGWFRPIVLLPLSAITGLSEPQLQSILAHELAHIQRFDPFVNAFQVWVEALLFYHPAVWWLNQKIRAEREHCCDDVAVSLCHDAVEYARALTLMEQWRSAPVLAMAANRGPLTARIVRLLGVKTPGPARRGMALTGSVSCLAIALMTGNAWLGMAHAKPRASLSAPSAPPAPAIAGFPPFPGLAAVWPQPAAPQHPASPAQPPAVSNPRTAKPRADQAQDGEQTSSSYIDGMKAAGLTNPSVDQLIALKIQGVTPDYVRGLRNQGLELSVEQLIALRVQGVTPEYVAELHASGLHPDQTQIIALKVQGADAEYYRQLKQAGIDPDVDRLIALKVQGVTPEYVREIRAAGLTVNGEQIIALKVQDVTPEYLKGLHAQGIDPQADEAIALRVQDVTAEYAREWHALGLKPSVQELIALRVQDVTPEYVKALQAAGFHPGLNEIIAAKLQGITPEFMERARQHGFKDLTLPELIRLRDSGVLDSKADL